MILQENDAGRPGGGYCGRFSCADVMHYSPDTLCMYETTDRSEEKIVQKTIYTSHKEDCVKESMNQPLAKKDLNNKRKICLYQHLPPFIFCAVQEHSSKHNSGRKHFLQYVFVKIIY